MRRLTTALLAVSLACAAAASLVADSSRASLRVGVEVTRRCTVTSGPSPEVLCTRTHGAATPAVLAAPRAGAPAVTIPAPAGTSSSRVVTVLF